MEDLTKMLRHIQEAQEKAQAVQKQLTHLQATGEAGAGAVKVTVNGHKQVLKLDIDKTFMVPEEKEVLQDLVVAAITLANQAVAEKVKEVMRQSMPEIPSGFPIDLMG